MSFRTRNLSGCEDTEGHVRRKLKLISLRIRDLGQTALPGLSGQAAASYPMFSGWL
jgi:hypothetical protein